MRMTIVSLVLLAGLACVDARWMVRHEEDDFTQETTSTVSGTGSESTTMAVGCADDHHVVFLMLPGDGLFHNGYVELRLDEGEIWSVEFHDNDNMLALSGIRASALVELMNRHAELRVRVMRWRNELVTDRFDLTGFSEAVAELPCSNAGGER